MSREDGFSVLESLIAAALVASALVALVRVATLGAYQAHATHHATAAILLAQAKLEQLRALPWTYDASGGPVSSPQLALSPPRTLVEDVSGWFEALNRFGAVRADGEAVHYRRRWRVTAVTGMDAHTLTLQVCVGARATGLEGMPEACVSAIRTRTP
jgi:hypothetical protein